jgi:hypothetical protein
MKPHITQLDLYVGCLFTMKGPVVPLLVVWMSKDCIVCENQLTPTIIVRIYPYHELKHLTHLNQVVTPVVHVIPGFTTFRMLCIDASGLTLVA